MSKTLNWIEPVTGPGGGPTDPDYGIEEGTGPGNELPGGGGGGAHPMPPIAELPSLPGIPVQPLPPHRPKPPSVGSGKPAGVPVLPMDPSWKPPTAPPHPPGDWVTLDAGKGQPPAWGFIPKDDGLGGGDVPTPKPSGGQAGHWVPVGKAEPKTTDPAWAYVPEIGPQYGIKQPVAGPK